MNIQRPPIVIVVVGGLFPKNLSGRATRRHTRRICPLSYLAVDAVIYRLSIIETDTIIIISDAEKNINVSVFGCRKCLNDRIRGCHFDFSVALRLTLKIDLLISYQRCSSIECILKSNSGRRVIKSARSHQPICSNGSGCVIIEYRSKRIE